MTSTHQLRRSAAFMLLVAVALTAMADDDKQSRILGNWLTESKDGIIQISVAAGGSYAGRIIGGNHP